MERSCSVKDCRKAYFPSKSTGSRPHQSQISTGLSRVPNPSTVYIYIYTHARPLVLLSRSQVLSRGEQQRLAILRLFWRYSLIPGIRIKMLVTWYLTARCFAGFGLASPSLPPGDAEGSGFCFGTRIAGPETEAEWLTAGRVALAMHPSVTSDGHDLAKLQLNAIQWNFIVVICSKPASASS